MSFVYNRTATEVRHMDCTAKKLQLLLLLALLAHLAHEAGGVATCCARGFGSCKLIELLCHPGRGNETYISRLNNGAAARILTLGERKVGERRVQERLQQLLHGSRNQAAGILTMGKRFEHAREPRPGAPAEIAHAHGTRRRSLRGRV